jgi:hypothetical protein
MPEAETAEAGPISCADHGGAVFRLVAVSFLGFPPMTESPRWRHYGLVWSAGIPFQAAMVEARQCEFLSASSCSIILSASDFGARMLEVQSKAAPKLP